MRVSTGLLCKDDHLLRCQSAGSRAGDRLLLGAGEGGSAGSWKGSENVFPKNFCCRNSSLWQIHAIWLSSTTTSFLEGGFHNQVEASAASQCQGLQGRTGSLA